MFEDEYKECDKGASCDDLILSNEAFDKFDKGGKGVLTRIELRSAIEHVTGTMYSMNHIETLWQEFDKDDNGTIDAPEFRTLMKYIKNPPRVSFRKSIYLQDLASQFGEDFDIDAIEAEDLEQMHMSKRINRVVQKSKRDSTTLLKSIASELHQVRDLLCVQDDILDNTAVDMTASMALDFDDLMSSKASFAPDAKTIDPDFDAAFPPSDMRCLALVSHNGMKKTMRQFVETNKNVLKKFRLTGTNSTMTMLKEVFKDEPAGTVVFGPACASGPLGGDAELVALLVSGKIGGIFFFQDPMDSHPHRADIDCLCRQALVHNTMMAETPNSALMMLHCLRSALQGTGRPELIPSFFFSLQSPTVEAYKKQQKSVVDKHKAMQSRESMPYSTVA